MLYTKCGDVNGDLNITPADAQAIFEKYLAKSELPCDCSCNSRTASLFTQMRQSPNVNLIINDIQVNQSEEIFVPVIVDNPFNIKAYRFDLLFPSEILEFVGVERTELQKDFVQVDANKIVEGVLRVGGYRSTPIMDRSPRVLITLVFRVIGEAKGPNSFTIINAVDDIKNASEKNY